MKIFDDIPPDRLMEAVDAIFAALAESEDDTFALRPSEMMGRESQPRAFCEFTTAEIAAAETFLVRCGLLAQIRSGNEAD